MKTTSILLGISVIALTNAFGQAADQSARTKSYMLSNPKEQDGFTISSVQTDRTGLGPF